MRLKKQLYQPILLAASLLALTVLTGCAPRPRLYDGAPRRRAPQSLKSEMPSNVQVGTSWTCNASYYGNEFHGRNTASGEPFDPNGISAAHNELPFGTVLEVVNLKNNRSLRVRVNDRGPFVDGRDLDLSLGAARELGMVADGVAPVRITIIELGPDE